VWAVQASMYMFLMATQLRKLQFFKSFTNCQSMWIHNAQCTCRTLYVINSCVPAEHVHWILSTVFTLWTLVSQAFGYLETLLLILTCMRRGCIFFFFSLNPVLTKTRVVNWNLLSGWFYAFWGGELARICFFNVGFWCQLWLLWYSCLRKRVVWGGAA